MTATTSPTDPTAEHPKLGVIVVGTGFGLRVHVTALRAAGFEVMGLVGRDREKTTRRAGRIGVDAYVSLDEALEVPGVDAVTIASPPVTHRDHALAAIAAGKHVICEKPLAATVDEAAEMTAAASGSGLVCLVGYEFRFSLEQAVMAQAVANGAIGSCRMATVVTYNPAMADTTQEAPDWLFDVENNGGWLGGLGSHTVDRIRSTLGDIRRVAGSLTVTADRDVKADDTYTVLCETVDGISVAVQETGGAWGEQVAFVRMAGTAGTIWSEGPDVLVADRHGTRRLSVPDDLRLPTGPEAKPDPRSTIHLEIPPYMRLAEVFRDRILGRDPVTSVAPATFADGLAAMRVLAAIRRSAADGRWVDLE